jgi:hypothetical protein
LFSQDRVAKFINQYFEPAWESVRPVPIVRIDFGNGKVLTRTLHGNILTAVCTPEGNLLDALPGIYEAPTYLDRLDQLRLLAQHERAQPLLQRPLWVANYHRRQAEVLKKGLPHERFVELIALAYVTKREIERPLENVLVAAYPEPKAPRPPRKNLPPDVARWATLAEDTRINESARRRQVHELLAREGTVRPSAVTKTIYKDVLHADLDDPYLGLGKVLFAEYPFASEDQAR